jgi:DNA mismatch repair protein MutS
MMAQYMEVKRQNRDKLILFRLGDFYEFFFDDAKTVSRELGLTLTARQNDVPMCGIPHHAADGYIAKLIQKGYKLAVCDQTEDPKLAKKLVKREVTALITPGTVTNLQMLSEKKNNYLFVLWSDSLHFSVAFADVSTGDFYLSATRMENREEFLDNLLSRFPTKEILASSAVMADEKVQRLLRMHGVQNLVAQFPDWKFEPAFARDKILCQFNLRNLKPFGLEERPELVGVAGAALAYVEETQRQALGNIKPMQVYSLGAYMYLDRATIRNLELVSNNQDGGDYGSLISVIDRTLTPMGGRLLRQRLLQPLLDRKMIEERLDKVTLFFEESLLRGDLRSILQNIHDLERLATKVSLKKANPKELMALCSSLKFCQAAMDAMKGSGHYLWKDVGPIISAIEETLVDDPSLDFEDGRVIRQGVDPELDRCLESQTKGKDWILQLEEQERKRTKIGSLKIRYNNIFGYYIEVTNANLPQVPQDYIRKQTLTNAERFTNQKLQEYESVILGAKEKVTELQKRIYDSLLERLKEHIPLIQEVSLAIAGMDVDASHAEIAKENRYVRPEIAKPGVLSITAGRHPVVEHLFRSESFIPNDLLMDEDENRIFIITGPNMAGKSTYLRQNALIVLLAQVGSFVPATAATVGICDKIFTRVGASDNLIRGESTFLVEMQETANILRNATRDSFIIMDEIGRGTSTYDGLSLAWSIVEYLAEKTCAKTLFATHYHEMTVLDSMKGVRNFNIMVKEYKDDIVFLRKIVAGSADRSYGIQVAKLAGVPVEVLKRAKQILTDLETDNVREMINEQRISSAKGSADHQIPMFKKESHPIVAELRDLDTDSITPVEALNLLVRWKKNLLD